MGSLWTKRINLRCHSCNLPMHIYILSMTLWFGEAYSKNHRIESVVLPDKSAVSASLQFLQDHGIVVEPACGVALAAVYEKVAALSGYKTVLVIVCGGVGSTADDLVELARLECDVAKC